MTLNYNNIDALGWKSDESAALLSLRTALQAYFETYRATYEEFSNPLKFDDSQLIRSFVGPSPTFKAISLALLLFQFVR